MWRQFAFGVILGVFVGLGLGVKVEVSLDKPDAGFFLKPMFRGQEVFSLDSQERPFVVTRPTGPVTVKAKYGPFTAKEILPLSLLQASLSNHSGILSNFATRDVDISAHLVSRTITPERPVISVLFHASPLSHSEENKIKSAKSHVDENRWCVQMHVQREHKELTSVCVISAGENVCVAELTIPTSWWIPNKMSTVEAFYSVYLMENSRCSNPAVQHSEHVTSQPDDEDVTETPASTGPVKTLISTVALSHGQVNYQELKEDQHILVYIPQKSFYPGSKFRVPIKLQAESDLQIFVIKVKARHGLRIVEAVPSDPSVWRINLDLNHKSKGAMVTASVADVTKYHKVDRVQSIFDFVLEVDDGASGEDRGRLSFTLAYEMNTRQREMYGSVENRVVARLDIQQDNTHAIVPVIKSSELINMAMLTGNMISLPMRIYSLSQGGKVTDITSTTTCHSGDEDVLKVAQSCNLVYMDGTETRGSASVSIIAKYGRHNEFLFFRVWIPDFPLEIQLSDDKLSQIKGWKVPIDLSTASRKTRGVDFGLLTHPDLLFHEEGLRKEDLDLTCQLRYQQSEVEVFARFVLSDGDRKQYYIHRKALFKITDVVLPRLRVADVSVADLHDNIIEGLKPGRTEIQVVTRLGRVMAAREVRVLQGKVSIDKLEVDVVTGLSVTVDPEPQMEGVLKANIHRDTDLTRNYQEGILDIKIWYDDGTSTPLHQVTPTDYFLETDTLNNHVVAFGPQLREDLPRVIALGGGKGELLKISLELSEACQRKKSRNLAVSYVYVNINFSDNTLQSDAGMYHNRANERYGPQDAHADGSKIFISMDDNEELAKNKGHHGYADMKNTGKEGSSDRDRADFEASRKKGEYVPNSEAQQQMVVKVPGMTPLEIGMYVLLAIFCLAIIVFMINCMIFVARYKRKRKPQETKDPMTSVNDWVWIGRATLERNAINTTCSQTLMSDADFNGNHNMQYLTPSESNNTKVRASVAESNSNRNSVISTYKGSECSIRITTNPLPADAENTDEGIIEEDTSVGDSSPDHTPVQSAPPPPPPLPLKTQTTNLTSCDTDDVASDCLSLDPLASAPRVIDPRASDPCPGMGSPLDGSLRSIGLRVSCPATFTLTSDSDDCSLGRDYFQDKEPQPGPSRSLSLPEEKSRPHTDTKASSESSDSNDQSPEVEDLGIGEAAACAAEKDPLQQKREALQVALVESIKAQQDSANGNLAAGGNISDAEWDYEVMGLTYDQLMDYFDNLKESTA